MQQPIVMRVSFGIRRGMEEGAGRMSARFWLFSMVSAGAALASGLSLGIYATTAPRVALGGYEAPAPVADNSDIMLVDADMNGPTEVRCIGCGPTLADRQMAAMGGWDGRDDPIVQDYDAQPIGVPEDLLAQTADPLPSVLETSSANSERVAVVEKAAPKPQRFAQIRSGFADEVQGEQNDP